MLCTVCQRPQEPTAHLICRRCFRSYKDDEKRRPDGASSQYGTIRWAAERAIRFERKRARPGQKAGARVEQDRSGCPPQLKRGDA